MSKEDIGALMERIDDLASGLADVGQRLTKVEDAVVTVMAKAMLHDCVLGWLKLAAVLLVGVGIGLGIITISDLIDMVK